MDRRADTPRVDLDQDRNLFSVNIVADFGVVVTAGTFYPFELWVGQRHPRPVEERPVKSPNILQPAVNNIGSQVGVIDLGNKGGQGRYQTTLILD